MINFDSLKIMFSGYDAYLVGGGARYVLNGGDLPRDWDVIVTDALPAFPMPYVRNRFGGRKYQNLKLDVWLGDIGKFLREVPTGQDGVAIHLETGAILTTMEYHESPGKSILDRPVATPANAQFRWEEDYIKA